MTEKRQKYIAELQVFVSAMMWSTAGILIKLIPWNAFIIAAGRSAFAGGVAALYMWARKMPFVLSRRTLGAGLALGVTMALFIAANKLTTAANAVVLQFTSPVFILIISSVLFKQRFRWADIAAVLVTLGGISLFFLDKLDAGNLFGNILGVITGVTFACYYISLGKSEENERLSAIIIADCITVAIGIPAMFTAWPEGSALPLIYIVILGVFQLGIPYVLLARGAQHCPPLMCSLIGAAEPLLNPVWVFLGSGEMPGVYALFGGAVVIVTITAWSVWSNKKDAAEAVSTRFL